MNLSVKRSLKLVDKSRLLSNGGSASTYLRALISGSEFMIILGYPMKFSNINS